MILYIIISYLLGFATCFIWVMTLGLKQRKKAFTDAFNKALENAKVTISKQSKKNNEMFRNIKQQSDKKFMEKQLKNKLNRDEKIENVNKEMIEKLIDTGMIKEDAEEFIKGKK